MSLLGIYIDQKEFLWTLLDEVKHIKTKYLEADHQIRFLIVLLKTSNIQWMQNIRLGPYVVPLFKLVVGDRGAWSREEVFVCKVIPMLGNFD